MRSGLVALLMINFPRSPGSLNDAVCKRASHCNHQAAVALFFKSSSEFFLDSRSFFSCRGSGNLCFRLGAEVLDTFP
jgi:hypothetical protein